MRILTYGLSADKLGGIETFLLNMNKYMSKDCIFDYVIERNEEMGNSTIHQTEINKKGGRTFYIARKRDMLQNLKDWRHLLKDNKGEYTVTYFNEYSLSWFIPIILCRQSGLKVFVHAHNNMLHDCGIVIKMLHQIGKILLKKMDIVRLTNSNLSSKFMFGDTGGEILIHNAISMERFGFNNNVRKRIRKELGLKGKHVYGFVGRIAYQKNPLYLIDVFCKIQEKDNTAMLILIGEGDLIDEVKAAVKEKDIVNKVLILGSVSNVQEYYQAMDVFLLPSRFEGLGIVLIEAQAAGLPCITSSKVVPQEAKVTNLLKYLPQEKSEEWANLAVDMAQREVDREKYKSIIENSGFNIELEARRLECIITE